MAIAEPPQAPSPSPPPPPPVPHESQAQGVPEDELIEFLGADDVEDETWWEFLKKAPPHRESPHAAPPEDGKQ